MLIMYYFSNKQIVGDSNNFNEQNETIHYPVIFTEAIKNLIAPATVVACQTYIRL